MLKLQSQDLLSLYLKVTVTRFTVTKTQRTLKESKLLHNHDASEGTNLPRGHTITQNHII